MKEHQPNLDMLSAYADGVLSPDAARSMAQHLAHCEVCAAAAQREQEFLGGLSARARVPVPGDFMDAVMGRVAQHPLHQPTGPIPWRSAMRAGVAASLLFVVLAASGVGWLIGSGALERAEPATMAAAAAGGVASTFVSALSAARDMGRPALALVESTGKAFWRVTMMMLSSGWLIQSALLLLTVSLNYAFTRMVLGYQRRH